MANSTPARSCHSSVRSRSSVAPTWSTSPSHAQIACYRSDSCASVFSPPSVSNCLITSSVELRTGLPSTRARDTVLADQCVQKGLERSTRKSDTTTRCFSTHPFQSMISVACLDGDEVLEELRRTSSRRVSPAAPRSLGIELCCASAPTVERAEDSVQDGVHYQSPAGLHVIGTIADYDLDVSRVTIAMEDGRSIAQYCTSR